MSNGAGSTKDKKPYQATHINLTVKNLIRRDFFFRIKRSTQLKKLMNEYCSGWTGNLDVIVFFFSDKRLRGEQTPDELKMEDGDTIYIIHRIHGYGYELPEGVETSLEALILTPEIVPTLLTDQTTHIKLTVNDLGRNKLLFQIKHNTPLKNPLKTYCDRHDMNFDLVCFFYDGKMLNLEETPDELKMENGDEIDMIPIMLVIPQFKDEDNYDDDHDKIDPFDFNRKLGFSSSDEDDVALVPEKGPVSLRDFPHPRHLCGNFPFGRTSHESYCSKCFCYVCEVVAPCSDWWGSNGHCKVYTKK